MLDSHSLNELLEAKEMQIKKLRVRIMRAEEFRSSYFMEFVFQVWQVLSKPSLRAVVDFPHNLKNAFLQTKRRRSRLSNEEIVQQLSKDEGNATNAPTGRCYVFMAINGAGLGHLSRCMAIATKLRDKEPSAQIVFITTSLALPLINKYEFQGYYVPSPTSPHHHMSMVQWDKFLANTLTQIEEIHKPDVFVFDGVEPYQALIGLYKRRPNMKKVWVRRGLYRPQVDVSEQMSFAHFYDRLITPGELGNNPLLDADPLEINRVNPILLCDHKDLLPRGHVRSLLNIPQNKKAVYIQLGAGNINDIQGQIDQIMGILGKRNDTVEIFAESIITNQHFSFKNKTPILLRDYPNAIFYNGFDLGILSAGYNTVYESILFGLPSVFLPNTQTKADDQVLRAKLTSQWISSRTVTEYQSNDFENYVTELLDSSERKSTPFENGAIKAAELILSV